MKPHGIKPPKKKPLPRPVARALKAPEGIPAGKYEVVAKGAKYLVAVQPDRSMSAQLHGREITEPKALLSFRQKLKHAVRGAAPAATKTERAAFAAPLEKGVALQWADLSRAALKTMASRAFDMARFDPQLGIVALKGTEKGTLYYEIDPKTGSISNVKDKARIEQLRDYFTKEYKGKRLTPRAI